MCNTHNLARGRQSGDNHGMRPFYWELSQEEGDPSFGDPSWPDLGLANQRPANSH